MRLFAIVKAALWPVDRLLALGAYLGVGAYRRWISPYKGFVCAHNALTGEPSCSAVASTALRGLALTQAVPLIREQFRRCRHTYALYRGDLLESTNEHLAKFAALAATGALACPCPNGGGGGGGGGPLGQLFHHGQVPARVAAADPVRPPAQHPPVDGDARA